MSLNIIDTKLQKTISIAIIGKPNAGKSSLLNKLIKHKLSIVTPKVQTTRTIITGIVTIKDTQIILLDTPGIFNPKKQLEKAMVRCAWSSLYSVDIVMLIIDSLRAIDDMTLEILQRLKQQNIKPVFLLNKIDLKSAYIDDIENFLRSEFENLDTKIFRISATAGQNVQKLLDYIVAQAKPSNWLYSEDDITNLPMRFLAAEITREQLFLNLHEELPYNLTVQSESFTNNPDQSITINQVIIVSKDSYKAMILGKYGAKIKEIGSKARAEIESIFESRVHLFLFVKVREAWESNPESYSDMMLPFVK